MNQAEFRIRTQTDGILRLAQAVLIYQGAHRIAHWQRFTRSRKWTVSRSFSPVRR